MFLDLNSIPISSITPDLLRLIPSEIARSWQALPFRLEGQVVHVAVPPSDVEKAASVLPTLIQSETVQEVRLWTAAPEEIAHRVNLLYGVGEYSPKLIVSPSVEPLLTEDQFLVACHTSEGHVDLLKLSGRDGEFARHCDVISKFCGLLLLEVIKRGQSGLNWTPGGWIHCVPDNGMKDIPPPPRSWWERAAERFQTLADMNPTGKISAVVGSASETIYEVTVEREGEAPGRAESPCLRLSFSRQFPKSSTV